MLIDSKIFKIFVVTITLLQIFDIECRSKKPLAPIKNFIKDVQSKYYKTFSSQRLKTFMDLVAPGYAAEQHKVVTEDGYVLVVHRISGNNLLPKNKTKPVVLFIHGMLAASDVWILRGPKHDLVYSLVDEGYDIWALNVRGNFYSKHHKKLSAAHSQFWEFSWHEIGVYDVPATIDYILQLTHQSNLSLVGHSMGGTVELVFLSELSKYNAKLNVVIAWAPVSIVTHKFPGLINNVVFRYSQQIEKLFKLFNVHEILPRKLKADDDFVQKLILTCDKLSVRSHCAQLYEYVFGLNDLERLNFSLLASVRQHYPQGTSLQTLSHYQQIIVSRQFKHYDFGRVGNAMKYGNFSSPLYSLENIQAPFVIYYGLDDPFSTPQDIEELLNEIPHAVARQIPYHNFGHLDFILSNETRYFYNNVMEVLNHYNK